MELTGRSGLISLYYVLSKLAFAITQENQAVQQANKYTFTDANKTTEIVFFPQEPGPITLPGGPQLNYKGIEGSFTFRGSNEVEQQDGPLGSLFTVVLEKSIDAGALTLTLVLPPVNLAGKKTQTFETVAIKTKSFGILPREGARLIYEVVCLSGLAEIAILPL
jgi:hypothetical protein